MTHLFFNPYNQQFVITDDMANCPLVGKDTQPIYTGSGPTPDKECEYVAAIILRQYPDGCSYDHKRQIAFMFECPPKPYINEEEIISLYGEGKIYKMIQL